MRNVTIYNQQIDSPVVWDNVNRGDDDSKAWIKLRQVLSDARLVIVLPSDFTIPDVCSLHTTLTSISESAAHVEVTLGGFDEPFEYYVPVYTESAFTTAESFVLLSESFIWEGEASLHPDCVVFLQEPPWIKADITDELTTTEQITHVGKLQKLSISSGFNVSVGSVSNSDYFNIYILANPAAGKGVWTESPWTGDSLPSKTPEGIRSINGLTGDVFIEGDKSVDVVTTVNNTGVSITIKHKTSSTVGTTEQAQA